MAVKNKNCTTTEPASTTAKPITCPGTVVAVEFPIVINGTKYARYEKCQRCGQVYPG